MPVAAPLPGEPFLFKDTTTGERSIKAMWQLIRAISLALNHSKNYDFVVPLGGDQVIVNFDVPLMDLIPESAREKIDQYHIFVEYSSNPIAGFTAAFIFRNTDFTKEWVQNWFQFSARGNYVIEDQTVANYLLLETIAKELGKPLNALASLGRGGINSIFIPESTLDFQKRNMSRYREVLRSSGTYMTNLFSQWYGDFSPIRKLGGTGYFTSTCSGRQVSKICVFPTFSNGMCGYKTLNGSWYRGLLNHSECALSMHTAVKGTKLYNNVKLRNRHHFIVHQNGPKDKSVMDKLYRRFEPYFVGMNLSLPSALYDQCVKQFEETDVWN